MSETIAAKNLADPALKFSVVGDFDLEKAVLEAKEEMVFKNLVVGGKTFNIEFSGPVCTDGVSVSEFDDKQVYAIGVLTNSEDIDGLTALQTFLDLYLSSNGIQDWATTQPVKNDRVYLKVLFSKAGRARFLTNIPIDMKKPQNAKIAHGQNVACKVSVSVYFSLKDKKAGIVLHPVSFNFDK